MPRRKRIKETKPGELAIKVINDKISKLVTESADAKFRVDQDTKIIETNKWLIADLEKSKKKLS